MIVRKTVPGPSSLSVVDLLIFLHSIMGTPVPGTSCQCTGSVIRVGIQCFCYLHLGAVLSVYRNHDPGHYVVSKNNPSQVRHLSQYSGSTTHTVIYYYEGLFTRVRPLSVVNPLSKSLYSVTGVHSSSVLLFNVFDPGLGSIYSVNGVTPRESILSSQCSVSSTRFVIHR